MDKHVTMRISCHQLSPQSLFRILYFLFPSFFHSLYQCKW
uniref:Uncharacterized protein n=1 Tax=Arundo donax TaxID=35708 RepID=A0A0A9BCK3_ARUDO